MRVLAIEPDSATAASIELMLKAVGFQVYTTGLGAEGVELARLYDYDIVLLELNMRDMSGYEVVRTLRVAKVLAPICILSGLADIQNKVRGLNYGADDYLTKPFHADELIARIRAIVRRSRGYANSAIQVGDLIVDLTEKKVSLAGRQIYLTCMEYAMLELLVLRKNMVVTTEVFLDHLYGGMDEPESNVVNAFIKKLRKKLRAVQPNREYIETVWGRGHTLRETSSFHLPGIGEIL